MVSKIGILLAVALFGVFTSAVPLDNEISDSPNENLIPIKNIAKCADAGGVTGIVNCVGMRALKSLQYINKQSILEIVPGVTLNSDNPISRVGKELTDDQLPTDPQEKNTKLVDMLLENGARLISGRTLKVKIPENIIENVSRALEEGRKRKKGGLNQLMGMFGMGAKMMAIIPAILGGLAILSTKALIVAKFALLVSAIVFFQYYGSKITSGGFLGGFGSNHVGHGYGTGYGGGGGYSGTYGAPTWTTNQVGGGGGSQYPYARSIDVAAEDTTSSAHDLAYSQYKH